MPIKQSVRANIHEASSTYYCPYYYIGCIILAWLFLNGLIDSSATSSAKVRREFALQGNIKSNNSVLIVHGGLFSICFRAKHLIQTALVSNDFLKNSGTAQIMEMAACMYEKSINQNAFVIREGDVGDALYVTAEGRLEVSKGSQILGEMDVGRAFGELALLYNCKRTASVKALTNVRVWTLDRAVYRQIMINSTQRKHEENLQFLKSIPAFEKLSQRKMDKLADVLEQTKFRAGEYIIRETEVGEAFYIIKSGQVGSPLPARVHHDMNLLSYCLLFNNNVGSRDADGRRSWRGAGDSSARGWRVVRREGALHVSNLRSWCLVECANDFPNFIDRLEKRSANIIAMAPDVVVLLLDRGWVLLPKVEKQSIQNPDWLEAYLTKFWAKVGALSGGNDSFSHSVFARFASGLRWNLVVHRLFPSFPVTSTKVINALCP